MFVKPWNKEADNILKQISKYGKAYTKDTKGLPIQFGHKCKDLINNDFLDIATIRNKHEKRTWFIIPHDIIVTSKINKKGTFYHFKRNNFL